MFSSEAEARDFPRGRIELGLCTACGFVWNMTFDPAVRDYSPLYEDQQCYSPTFNKFARSLAENVIRKYDLHDKDVVEIGCGKGDFLSLVCELGNNRGVGIDPSCERERIQGAAAGRINVIQDYYSDKYAGYTGDAVICRHALEHIPDTRSFVETVRRGIGDRREILVLFEIPEAGIVLEKLVFWDIYYEHCSYFSPGSLGRLFRASRFDVLDLYVGYDDQYLVIEASPIDGPFGKPHPREEPPGEMVRKAEHFRNGVEREKRLWRDRVRTLFREGKRPVIWGSGSKCVAFLTTLGLNGEIGCVVDINPRRHGKFIAGVVKQIMPPEYLKEFKPGAIIVMNPIYRDEIASAARAMGLGADILTV
jgi:SAM-dependent methyltransferase